MNSKLNYVSSQGVFARVSPLIKETNWREDAFLYLGDAIQMLGHKWSTKIISTPEDELLQVENHIVEIPCDIEELIEVHYQGHRLHINSDPSMLALSSDEYKWHGVGSWYMIQYPHIKTSFESGEIKIIARKFLKDDNGFIMIPDNPYYKDAIKWYIVYNLLLSGYTAKSNEVSIGYCQEQFEITKRESSSKLNTMTRDEREQFSRMWRTLNVSGIGLNRLRF